MDLATASIAVLIEADGNKIRKARIVAGAVAPTPLFVPEAGHRPDATMAELSPEEKDAISHRGDAFRQMVPVLRDLAATL